MFSWVHCRVFGVRVTQRGPARTAAVTAHAVALSVPFLAPGASGFGVPALQLHALSPRRHASTTSTPAAVLVDATPHAPDADLGKCAEFASEKYPWPGCAGAASVAAWLEHLSQPASKKHLAAAIDDIRNNDVDGAHGGLILGLFAETVHNPGPLKKAVDAIVEHLKTVIATKAWDADAVELALFKREKHLLTVPVVGTKADINKFNDRLVRPRAMMDLPSLPSGPRMLWTLEAGKVLVLYGSSGAGKTYGALLVGASVTAMKAVVYCVCKSVDVDAALEKRWCEERDADRKKILRDELAFKYVKSMVNLAIPESNRKKPPAGGKLKARDMVLVLDELGWGPHLVRGIISQHTELRRAIKELVHCGGDVHIIIAGTGVEGVAHDIGSSTTNYTAFQLRPQLWPALSERVPKRVNTLVNNESSATGGMIRSLVTNARCAAAFAEAACEWYAHTVGRVTEETMAHAAARAVGKYRGLNGLENLSKPGLVAVITSAMAAQLSEADEPQLPVDMDDLKVTYGVLVDNGVRSKQNTIIAPPGRPRYEVEPAFEAMLRLIIGMSNRPPTGEGFEQAFADFAALALTFAGLPARDGSPPRDLFSDESVRQVLAHCGAKGDTVPHGWSAPLTLVSWLRAHALRGGRSVGVETYQATYKVEPIKHGAGAGAIREMFEAIVRQSDPDAALDTPVADIPRTNAYVVINAGQSAWGDTFVHVPGSRGAAATCTSKDLFIMGQQKLFLSSTLYQHALLFELHKMGCTAEIVLAGAWAHTVAGADLGRSKRIHGVAVVTKGKDGQPWVLREALVQVIAKELSKGTTFAAWLAAHVPALSKTVAAAQATARTEQAALTAAMAEGLGAGTKAEDVDAAFVVAVFGKVAPLSPEVQALLPSNVLLLHAPAPVASSPAAPSPDASTPASQTAAEAQHQGRRLRGFYPVRVAHAGTAVQLCEVPVPVAPPPSKEGRSEMTPDPK